MIPLELSFLEPLGRVVARPWADSVTGMQVDSRRIQEGDLFVAIGGGADFVAHALARGASAALVPTDGVAALGAIAGEVRARSSARVVGDHRLDGQDVDQGHPVCACAPHRRTIANEGNYNTEIGVPLTLCRIDADTEVCICELAMRGLGQIAWLASFARPDIVVVTNVGPVHLELVGTSRTWRGPRRRRSRRCPRRDRDRSREEPLLEPYLTAPTSSSSGSTATYLLFRRPRIPPGTSV